MAESGQELGRSWVGAGKVQRRHLEGAGREYGRDRAGFPGHGGSRRCAGKGGRLDSRLGNFSWRLK